MGGPAGPRGFPGLPGSDGLDGNPGMPTGTLPLWSGYSLLHTVGNNYHHAQDLGSAGSCSRKFSTLPTTFCGTDEICRHASRNAKSYWLTTNAPVPMMAVQARDVSRHISRCNVCEAPSTVIAVHSQTAQPATTPCGWATRSLRTLPRVPRVADRICLVQALASRTPEPLHSSSVPVLEVLANSLPTVSASGCEPSTLTSSLPTHSFRLSRARSTAETRSLDARFASNLSNRRKIFKLNETKIPQNVKTTKLMFQLFSPTGITPSRGVLAAQLFFTHAVLVSFSIILFITPKV